MLWYKERTIAVSTLYMNSRTIQPTLGPISTYRQFVPYPPFDRPRIGDNAVPLVAMVWLFATLLAWSGLVAAR